VKLDAPEGAKKVVLTFGLFDAGNDWWWAIDNIEVRGVVLDQGPVDPGTEGLVAYYAFENDVSDSSGNGNNGTIVGDPVFVEGPAGFGTAMEFNGDDYVDCGNDPSLEIRDAITISYWFSVVAFENTWEAMLSKGDSAYRVSRGGGNGDATHFGISGTTGGGGSGWFNGNTLVTGGAWHHFAGTYDGAEGMIYIDGVLDATTEATGQINIEPENLWIGNNSQNVDRFFHGIMDEVMLYNRALSEAEIRYLAGERATPVDPGSTGLLGFWMCDEGEGVVVGDSSGNGRDGTIVNGDPVWVEGVSGTAVELVGPTLVEILPLDLELSEATMAGWIKPNGAQPDWSSIIMTRDPGPATGLNVLGFQLAYHWNDTSDSWSFRGGDMIAEDDWTFAAVTIEPDKATFYVNGEAGSVNEVTHEPILWNSNIYLGGDGTAGWVSRRMNGALDDVLMYDRALSAGEIRYLAGIREYSFEGDVLDDTWDHDNGSDQWDGTGPGDGNPGGAALLTEDDVTFLRIQDTGDPRDLGISEPSNRKVYLTRLTDISLDGLSLEVRIRVATTAPLDDQLSGDPWPAEGIGYHIRDGGKGMVGVSDGVGVISFSLGQAGEPDYVDAASDLLVMNNLVGAEPSGDVDTGDAANAVALNMMAIDDASQWNTFVIDIVAGGAGTHIVTVSANGGEAESFDVTAGNSLEADAPFIAIGSSGTGGITAFDVDSLSVSN
ncbi:MAG: LamG domain-containing protein, partial [Planctomycetes bacterium]|nr:LamG domain-containing protein [Planctomycetota bacterium]